MLALDLCSYASPFFLPPHQFTNIFGMSREALHTIHGHCPHFSVTYHFYGPTWIFKLRNASANPLPGLPLVGLAVLERKPTCPLVYTSLPADLTVAAGKQNTPQGYDGEEA